MQGARADCGVALTVSAPDGTRLAASLLPAPGLDRIVLLHSLGTDRSLWHPVVEALAGKATLLLVDLRGHGQSDAPEGPYSASLLASDLRAMLDALGWESAVVAGASLGGCVALQFASEFPRRVRGLGLFDTTAWYGDGAAALWAARGERALAHGLAGLAPPQTALWFGEGFRAAHPDVVERTVRSFVRTDPAGFAATCGLLGAFDARPLLQGIRVPAAILVGEADCATPPAMAAALQAGLPRATCTVVPGAAHFAPVEAPELAASLLLGFLHGDRTSDAPRADALPPIPSLCMDAQRTVAQEIIEGPAAP